MNLKIDNIRQLLIFTAKELHISEISYPYNEYLLYVIKDICLYKLVGSHNFKTKDKSNRFITLDYKNALLIKGKAIQQLFPVNDKLYSRPGVSYSYSPTIRSKITNYREAVCSMDPDLICHCKEYSEFIDNHHNHVITGNLNIITNLPIQSLLRKGLNYREKSPIQKDITLTSIINSIDIYISKIYQEIKSPITAFIPWKTEIIKKVMAVINKTSTYPIKKILDNIKNKSYIKDIHSKFVLVPIDKASNNISIICKIYYVQVLKEEITNSGNFQPVNNTKESVLTDAK